MLATTILAPILWQLWIYNNSANANYYFAINLFFSTAQIFLITDLLFASVKRDFFLKTGVATRTQRRRGSIHSHQRACSWGEVDRKYGWIHVHCYCYLGLRLHFINKLFLLQDVKTVMFVILQKDEIKIFLYFSVDFVMFVNLELWMYGIIIKCCVWLIDLDYQFGA